LTSPTNVVKSASRAKASTGTAVRRRLANAAGSLTNTPVNSSPQNTAAPDIPPHPDDPRTGALSTRTSWRWAFTRVPGLIVPSRCSVSRRSVSRCASGKPIAAHRTPPRRPVNRPHRIGGRAGGVHCGSTISMTAASTESSSRDHTIRPVNRRSSPRSLTTISFVVST
jgi:hypothetical protein